MNIIKYAESELNLTLSNFQKDILEILVSDPDAFQRKLKPATHDVRLALDVYSKWKELQNSLVAC